MNCFKSARKIAINEFSAEFVVKIVVVASLHANRGRAFLNWFLLPEKLINK